MPKPKDKKPTLADFHRKMSQALIEFGYPDASVEKMADITTAYAAGKRQAKLPHGVLGMWAEKWCEEAVSAGILVLKK